MNENFLTASEIHLKYEPKLRALNRPKIQSPDDAYLNCVLFLNSDNMNIKEEAVVLFLNRGNRVLGGYKVSSGGITGTIVDIRIILAIALKCLASGIILAHTHPSGELNPSRADQELTFKLKEACHLMDIKLLDHLIITSEAFYSFTTEALI